MSVVRPGLLKAWTLFSEINLPVKDVGEKIGGAVKANIDSGIFQNACPIRMSYVLNKCGVKVPRGKKYAVVSGGDGCQYIYRVNDMIGYLKDVFGVPDVTKKSPKHTDFIKKKGIIMFSGSGWSNARGHVTLWDGVNCSDACHFLGSDENGPFIPEVGYLWSLK